MGRRVTQLTYEEVHPRWEYRCNPYDQMAVKCEFLSEPGRYLLNYRSP